MVGAIRAFVWLFLVEVVVPVPSISGRGVDSAAGLAASRERRLRALRESRRGRASDYAKVIAGDPVLFKSVLVGAADALGVEPDVDLGSVPLGDVTFDGRVALWDVDALLAAGRGRVLEAAGEAVAELEFAFVEAAAEGAPGATFDFSDVVVRREVAERLAADLRSGWALSGSAVEVGRMLGFGAVYDVSQDRADRVEQPVLRVDSPASRGVEVDEVEAGFGL